MTPLLTDPKLTPELCAWAARRIPHVGEEQGFGPAWAVGIPHAGDLAAVVVWHDWQPRAGTVQLSMASATPRWINRGVVARVLGLAFAQPWRSGTVNKAWVAIPHTAERVIGLNVALGFKREGVLRHHFGPGVHAWVGGILAREWRARYGEFVS